MIFFRQLFFKCEFGNYLISSNDDFMLRNISLVEIQSLKTLPTLNFTKLLCTSMLCLQHTSLSPDGKLLVIVGDNPDGMLVNSQTGKVFILEFVNLLCFGVYPPGAWKRK